MVVGQLARDVRLLALGFFRTAGEPVSDAELPPAVWKGLVESGIIVLPDVTPRTRRETAAERRGRKMI